MRAPCEQWAIQIDVTNACHMRCANCTRMTAHVREPFFMSVDQFRQAVESVQTFPADSPPDIEGRTKVVGMIGGEPTLHPAFAELCRVIEQLVPKRRNRGLWTTGLGPAFKVHRPLIKRVFGYLHKHPHRPAARHQPVLIASEELVPDERERYKYIWDCWLQQHWCSGINPKGVFFCEVAAAMDVLFDGPGGLPIERLWWNRSLTDFHDQVHRWCNRCSVCMPLPSRMDSDGIDDVSAGNYARLQHAQSPGLGRCRVFDCIDYDPAVHQGGWAPREYKDLTQGEIMEGGP